MIINDDTVLIGATEIAKIMGVSRMTVNRMIKDGRLPAKSISAGQRLRYVIEIPKGVSSLGV
ncbi:hypothetical protein SU48_02955 [Deinococcus puniceus]|uniref:Helix-turn-helix domain-containing protein n=1 Tax=Deinococcus puniceus TaxID=1182568 RepID=A0A172T7G7_9DEIO|nr:hypothetical protein SU48_02955 [Deinococcus puniceus]